MWQTPVSSMSPLNSTPSSSSAARASATSSTWSARGYELAPWGRRAGALFIDGAIVAGPLLPASRGRRLRVATAWIRHRGSPDACLLRPVHGPDERKDVRQNRYRHSGYPNGHQANE